MPEPMSDERLAEISAHGVKHGGAELWTLLTFRDELVVEVERLRAELAERDRRLNQAMQVEARITHEWEQATGALERMGRALEPEEADRA